MRKDAAKVTVLGKARYPSPLGRGIVEPEYVPASIVSGGARSRLNGVAHFELAGPRSHIFFDPRKTRAGIVTCGGLSPGLNDVIRSLFFELHLGYGVREVLGFRWGYQGLDPKRGEEPIVLTPAI